MKGIQLSIYFILTLFSAQFLIAEGENRLLEDEFRLPNWGGNFRFSTQRILYPRTIEDVQKIVVHSKNLRVIGSLHSFSEIADCDDTLLSIKALNKVERYDRSVPSVTVQAGITYTDLVPELHAHGYALPNLAALAEITVGGATQTGTHGSGHNLESLSKQIRSMKVVLADGSIKKYDHTMKDLKGLAVGLGAFGVVVEIELNLVPAFNTIISVYQSLPIQKLYAHFDEIHRSGYTVNLVHNLMKGSSDAWYQVWVSDKCNERTGWMKWIGYTMGWKTHLKGKKFLEKLGAKKAGIQLSPFLEHLKEYSVEQNKEISWYYGLANYRVGLSGANGAEIESEYFVPATHGARAVEEVFKMREELSKNGALVILVRTIKGDDIWLSEAQGHDTVSIHITWKLDTEMVKNMLPQIEAALKPFNARPHWGKLFTMNAKDFLHLYPQLEDFKKLAQELDPHHKFRNKFLDEYVFADVDKSAE